MFADCLSHQGIDPDRLTIVPGNHDAYATPDAFAAALRGPLARWAKSARCAPGHVVDFGRLWLLPVDVSRHQSVTKSSGLFTDPMRAALRHRLLDAARHGIAAVVVQHHPPYPRPHILQRIDGLHGWQMLWDALAAHEGAQVVFGHLHEVIDGPAVSERSRGTYRLLGAPAVVDGLRAPSLRLYDVGPEGLVPVALPTTASPASVSSRAATVRA